jgi:hypothetical protein
MIELKHVVGRVMSWPAIFVAWAARPCLTKCRAKTWASRPCHWRAGAVLRTRR